MVSLFGPDTPASFPSGEQTPFCADAETLGEALGQYARRFEVSFEPYDGRWPKLPFDPKDPKWFFYRSKRPKWEEVLVDIHIKHGSDEICPRQNLSYLLQQDDEVHIGPIVC